MYKLFSRFWYGNRALDLVTSHTRYVPAVRRFDGAAVRPGEGAAVPSDLGLPDRYIAAKFYTGAALPGTPEARGALRELVRTAAARMPVVMLDTGMATDEHEDFMFRDIPNVTSLRDRLAPKTNLAVQTAAIAGAQGFIGTCGSLAWLAPLLGVDTLAVYSEERFLVSHIFFAAQAYRQAGAARFDTLDLRAVTELDLLASAAAVAQGRP
jgi:ADP-heptose:LPS heptosyltransferase